MNRRLRSPRWAFVAIPVALGGCAGAPVKSPERAPAATAEPAPVTAEAKPAASPAKKVRPPAPTPALAPVGSDVTAEFEVPEGLAVTVWAASPQLANPTNIDVDARGRIFLTEGVNYRRDVRHSTVGDGFLYHPEGDRVMILEDTDGDGAADTSKVFAQDPDLVTPLGVAVIGTGPGTQVIVSSSPHVLVFTDTDGDDKADKKEVFLTGFGGKDHDHAVHAFVAGPDGRYYFNTGNEGPHDVNDKAGFRFRKLDDDPRPEPPKSDDGRAWIMGVVLRVGPDGKGLGVLAHNFRNNYEVALDSFGNLFQNDNDDDGNESCRFTWVMEGGNYGYASARGQRKWWVDRRPGQAKPTAHWHQEDPGVVPPTDVTGPGAPTGLVLYEGSLLPDAANGLALNCDSGRSTVYGHRLKAAGAGFAAERFNFLKSRTSAGDRAKWFRPSDVAVGPDGAVYVSDWYDAVVGGHAMLDAQGAGRILRVAPKGAKLSVPKLDLSSDAGQIEALRSPAVNVRYLGQRALRARGEAALPVLEPLFADKDLRVRARAAWIAASAGPKGLARVEKLLADKAPELRVTALRAIRQQRSQTELLPYLKRLVRDSSPSVRREVAVALRDVPAEAALPLLVELAKGYDGKDRLYLEALGIAADGKESALWTALAPLLGNKDPLRWSPAWTSLTWRLHPPEAVAGLRARAEATSLGEVERQQALVALSFVPHVDGTKAVIELAESERFGLRTYALALALPRADAEWKSFGVGDRLKALQIANAKGEQDARVEALKVELQREGVSAEQRAKTAVELAGSKQGGLFLIGLASSGKLAPELKQAVAEPLFRNPDVGVRALASQHFERPAFEGTAYPSVPELLKMKGDPAKGREIFFGPTAACTSCHEFGGKGRSVGPELTRIGEKLGRDALLDAVLNPSAGIAFGYDPWVIVTKDQSTITGFIVADGDNVALKDPAGQMRFIPKSEITHREKQKTSLMPDNIALGMKPQELVDLVEFLTTAVKAPEGKGKRP